MTCDGCGEGVQEYRIRYPNGFTKDKRWFNVCEHCVDFYDFAYTRKKLETIWDKEIDVRK
jgi:hypothetical protein